MQLLQSLPVLLELQVRGMAAGPRAPPPTPSHSATLLATPAPPAACPCPCPLPEPPPPLVVVVVSLPLLPKEVSRRRALELSW